MFNKVLCASDILLARLVVLVLLVVSRSLAVTQFSVGFGKSLSTTTMSASLLGCDGRFAATIHTQYWLLLWVISGLAS